MNKFTIQIDIQVFDRNGGEHGDIHINKGILYEGDVSDVLTEIYQCIPAFDPIPEGEE